MQKEKWQPVLDWFSERFGAQLVISYGLDLPPITTEIRAALARHFLSYDFSSLTAICFGVEALKSPVLMLACSERRLQPSEAVELARLEEEFQLLRWGRVPWAHELAQAELTARVSAAALVLHCSNDMHSAANKVHPGQSVTQ
ncbi:ATP synthase mitochondrial F1 complex assembly factor 2 [Eumeta japonica]|uniref:ATP synthase mitochondrial F1 complex assembly factor 2 n=1 Tax=Eumeta variegata TaxID=151549 RepID=A0A4C1T9R9_EUMVA|nr:ATP synthase mitochondrial F1 complex assembly factor 2 [Eumeta japonica]